MAWDLTVHFPKIISLKNRNYSYRIFAIQMLEGLSLYRSPTHYVDSSLQQLCLVGKLPLPGELLCSSRQTGTQLFKLLTSANICKQPTTRCIDGQNFSHGLEQNLPPWGWQSSLVHTIK